MKGPIARSDAFRLLKGETRPSRVNYNAPQFPGVTDLKPPLGLHGAGRLEWLRLVPVLIESGVLTVGDIAVLEDYCRALSDLRRYEAKAARAGADVAIAKGYANQVVKLRAQANHLRTHLGLTPVSRRSVKAHGHGQMAPRLNQFLASKNNHRGA